MSRFPTPQDIVRLNKRGELDDRWRDWSVCEYGGVFRRYRVMRVTYSDWAGAWIRHAGFYFRRKSAERVTQILNEAHYAKTKGGAA